jgi:4-amino-4-deoxy-L-arabinose transferase-like glycosyltransferase
MKRIIDWATANEDRRVCLALLGLCLMIYIPLAGNYGMWDPWETHYGEVARQMLERNDFVSLWWPGSPQDRAEFWSKPVLTFWLMAFSMKLAGLEWSGAAPSQMADSWRAEWASRLPFIVLGIAAVWATWELTRRLAGRRAGALAAVVLATSVQWMLITRQAMTDMAFVSPMTVALAFAGLGLLLPVEERERELERHTTRIGKLTLSWPRATAFYVFLALYALSAIPQLLAISVQLHAVFRVGVFTVRLLGLVVMLPYILGFVFALWWCARAKNKRQLYLFSGYVLCAVASLAKGPAGVALPAIVLALYLVLAGRWKEIWTSLEIPRGVLLFVTACFPWYHAMLIRHGMGFWNEFIGDNYVHRAGGRHGDRGTFEYYLQYIEYGMFPWSGIVTLAGLLSFKRLRDADARRGLIGFALLWFIAELTVMSLVNTKFHHYILPALPALAILAGILLDEILTSPARVHALGLLLVAAPITWLSGSDLAAFPPRVLWLFNYDYVNMPGTGRPWPLPSLYGDRYEYHSQYMAFAILATLGTLALGVLALLGRTDESRPPATDPVEDGPYRDGKPVPASARRQPPSPGRVLAIVAGFLVTLVAAIGSGPSAPNGLAPTIGRLDWLLPTALMLPATLLLAWVVSGGLRSARNLALWSLTVLAVVWSGFILDKIMIELSPHWSQKHVLAAYYAKRRGPEEPIIAWQLYWRGENFYTRNELYRSPNPAERTVFLGDHNAEKMQQYFTAHPGKRVFFVVERTRYEALRALLPQAARSTLTVMDDSNNKIYLAAAQL